MIKKIWNNLPQLSIIIILLSLLKIFLYYNNFNVPIKYYIGLNELGLLIAEDLFIIVPMVIFLYLYVLDSRSKQELINLEKQEYEENIQTKELKRSKIWNFLNEMAFYFLIIIGILAGVGLPIYLIFSSSPYHEKIIGFATLFLTILFIFFIRKSEKSQEFITSEFALHSILLVAFLIIFVFNVSDEIRKVEEGEFTGTNIITKDSTYNSTDSAFFIGQTSKYIFFHNKKDKYTTILPTSEVLKIDLYSK